MEQENVLVPVAMQIILHAGDSRLKITEALEYAQDCAFDQAYQAMDDAEACITLAHKAQTEIIQNEASGSHYEYCLLFTHAQDTLMCVNSELRMAKQMIEILKKIQK